MLTTQLSVSHELPGLRYYPLAFEGIEGLHHSPDVELRDGYAQMSSLEAGGRGQVSIRVSLAPNPSHLEAVNAIVQVRHLLLQRCLQM